jgi:hypothetical protein
MPRKQKPEEEQVTLWIHSRAEWGAAPPIQEPVQRALKRGIIVHWNGPGMGAYSMQQVPDIIKATQRFHQQTQGWNDIAYNHSVDRFGRVWEGRGIDIANAASGDSFANNNLHALECLCGVGDPFTAEMQNGIVEYVQFQYSRGIDHTLYVHNDVAQTACPGAEISHWVRNVLPGLVDSPPPIVIPQAEEEKMHLFIQVGTNGTIWIVRNGKKCLLSDAFGSAGAAIPQDWPHWKDYLQQLFKAGQLQTDPDNIPELTFEAMWLIPNGPVDGS